MGLIHHGVTLVLHQCNSIESIELLKDTSGVTVIAKPYEVPCLTLS